ncbi:hypothetical protein ATCC90586_003309 [Pythium insidiosum]|nr:hypothetical protein ATCC90586_003309 [Pythium insidiosum]
MAPPAAATELSTLRGTSPLSHTRAAAAKSFRPKDLVIGSDTDSASEHDGSVGDSQFSTAPSSTVWSAYRQLDRHERFTSGADAVLQVAGQLSDNVFVYPLLQGPTPSADTNDDAAAELRARVVRLEIRSGAAAAIRGALAVGSSAAALVPSQTLPLFLPNLFEIAQRQQPAVFHVAAEAIRRDLAVGSSYEALYALQHSGAVLLNAATPQECHDLAVVAHVAARRLHKLVVHFYDGARVARELAKLQLLTPSALQTLSELEASSAVDVAVSTGAEVAEHLQLVMDDLFPVLQQQYRVFEYSGAADAETVVVVVGEAAAALQDAVAYEQMLGARVGVVQVRALLPWSHALFAQALPATATRVAVLENISPGAFAFQRGLLTQHVQVFLHATGRASDVVVTTGIYGGVFRNHGFSLGMARAVLHHAATATTRRSFVVAKSEALYEAALEATHVHVPQLDVVYGQRWELRDAGRDAYAKQFLFWGFDDESGQRGAPLEAQYRATLGLLQRNPATQVHALVTHAAPTARVTRAVSTLEVRLGLPGRSASLQQGVELADVTVVSRAELLRGFDVAATVKPGGTLLVHCGWKTSDDLIDEAPAFKARLAAQRATLLVVDVEELQTRVADDTIAAVAPHVAFLKAAALLDERVVFALLQREFPAEQHAELRAFVAAVWGEVVAIDYPAREWARLGRDDDDEADDEADEDNGNETERATEGEPLAPLAAIAPNKLSHSPATAAAAAAAVAGKRARPVSKHTTTAWQLVFRDAFDTRQDVRDHVTDVVRVTKWERLTPLDYERNVFHVEMDIRDTKIRYNIGEALAVFAHNDERDVVAFLQSYGVDPEALVSLPVAAKAKKGAAPAPPTEETLTYFQLFAQVLDIFGRPSKKFYQALAARATDEKEKDVLSRLLDADGKDEYKRRVDETLTFADLLTEFPSARPSMDELVALVPRIKPRHYSIASSMKLNPTSVHLLIVVHDWTTPSGRYRVGQATRFLSSIQPGQLLSVSVCSSVMKLPVNHADPIIMAGLGTGMAPFRAFIQERAFLKAQGVAVGPIALYFGSRHKAKEFLYGDELEQYEKDGLLTYLRCAFSRDQQHKIYIQDRIAEDKTLLADLLLRRNGHFYLCGPTWPVADVREALITSFIEEAGMDRKQANAYIERMREEGRYVLEVY